MFDKDGSGNIDIGEMREAMKALGVYMNKEEVRKLMLTVDTDGNGFIDYDEFRALMKEYIKNRNKEEELTRAFRIYDEDDTGLIEFADLQQSSIPRSEFERYIQKTKDYIRSHGDKVVEIE